MSIFPIVWKLSSSYFREPQIVTYPEEVYLKDAEMGENFWASYKLFE